MKDLFTYIIGLFFGILISTLLILYSAEIKKIFLINDRKDNIAEHFKNRDEYDNLDYQNEKNQQLNILTYDDLKNSDFIKEEDERYNIYDENIKDKYKINSFIKTPSLIHLISSYENESTLENIEGLKWKLDNNSKYINDIIVSKQPLKNRYILNPNVYGYNLNNVSIAFNNNYNSFINNLGILFTLKMNNIINGNLLTINDYYNDIISINIMHSNKQKNNNDKIVNIVDNYGLINVDEDYNLNTKKEYNIEILTNGYKYYINNISEAMLNEPAIFIGLIIDKNSISFHINDKVYDFKRLDVREITIDSPFYINKNLDCDIILYSSALLINDITIKKSIDNYKLYNKYNLYYKMNI
jgi:hypothetical protein